MEHATITLSREQLNEAARQFDILQQAQDLGRPVDGENLSFSRRAPRVYAHYEAASQLAAQLGEEQTRALFGNAARRDAAQLFAQPTISDVHVDAILTNISIAYRNPEYIGPFAAPRVQVTNRSDVFFVFGTANLRNDAQVRAPGTDFPESGYTLSTDSYKVENYSIAHGIPDEVRRNADNPLSPDRDGANFVADVLDLKYEKAAASLINTSANWTTNVTLSGTDQWSDQANSDPFDDLKTARTTIVGQIARRPNTLILGYQTFETLALHPDLLDRCKYTGTGERPAMVTTSMMASLFMVDQVLIGTAIENTAVEGQSDSLAFVWGKHAWLGYVPASPAISTPAAAYAFTTGRMVDRYRDEARKRDVLRAEEAWDMEVTAAGAGYRIVNATA